MSGADTFVKLEIFVSHSWRDMEFAVRLRKMLSSFANVWLDMRNLRPGEPIQATIDEALAGTDIVLLVWTDHAKASDGVRKELEKSLALDLRVVPCVLRHDESGSPDPPFDDTPLAGRDPLWVDFHTFSSGAAQLINLVLELRWKKLPPELHEQMKPTLEMIGTIQGFLNYMGSYDKRRGGGDRLAFVDHTVDALQEFFDQGGDPEEARELVELARAGMAEDPALQRFVERMDAILSPRAGAEVSAPPPASLRAPDGLAERLRQHLPADQVVAWVRRVEEYLLAANAILERLKALAEGTRSRAAMEIVSLLRQYLERDLIPDHVGVYGTLDDAWLVVNTGYHLVKGRRLPAAAFPVDWESLAVTDALVLRMLPPQALSWLDTMLFQMLQRIAVEVPSYEPSFAPVGHAYAPRMPRRQKVEHELIDAMWGV